MCSQCGRWIHSAVWTLAIGSMVATAYGIVSIVRFVT